jgi:hypothetical protein
LFPALCYIPCANCTAANSLIESQFSSEPSTTDLRRVDLSPSASRALSYATTSYDERSEQYEEASVERNLSEDDNGSQDERSQPASWSHIIGVQDLPLLARLSTVYERNTEFTPTHSVVSSRPPSIFSGRSQQQDFPATPSRHSRSHTDPGYSSPAPRRGSKVGDRIAFYEERNGSPSLHSPSPSLHSRSPSVPTATSPHSTSYTMPSTSQFTAQSPTSYGYTKSSTHPSLSQVTAQTQSSPSTRSYPSSQSSSSTGRLKPHRPILRC